MGRIMGSEGPKIHETNRKKQIPIIEEFEKLGKKHGRELVLSSARRWIREVAERTRLMKEKDQVEKELQKLESKLK